MKRQFTLSIFVVLTFVIKNEIVKERISLIIDSIENKSIKIMNDFDINK